MNYHIQSKYIWSLILVLNVLTSATLYSMDTQTNSNNEPLLAHALEYGPEELRLFAQQIQDTASQPYFVNRILMLVGEHGMGKTALAKAILHAARNTVQIFTGCGSFTTQPVIQPQKDKKTVMVFDDIDLLYPQHTNSNTAELTTLLNLIDSQQTNQNLFIIGTLRNIQNAPESLKSRALGHTVWLQEPSMANKIAHLRFLFTQLHKHSLADECTDQFFDTACITKIEAHTFWDLGAIANKSIYLHRKQNATSGIDTITVGIINQAMSQIVDEKQKMHDQEHNPYGLSPQELEEANKVIIAAQTTQAFDIDQFTRELASTILHTKQQKHVFFMLEKKGIFQQECKEKKKKNSKWW